MNSDSSIKNAVRAAENRVEAGFANLRGAESAIFSAVVGAYMDVIRDEAIVDLNRAQVGVLQVNLEGFHGFAHSGGGVGNDLLQHYLEPVVVTRVPTLSPSAARTNAPGWVMFTTRSGILLSRHSTTAVASITASLRIVCKI